MSDQPSSNRISVGGVADAGEESHEAASFNAARGDAEPSGEARDTNAEFSPLHDGTGSPDSAASEHSGLKITGRFGRDLDDVELDPPSSPEKPRRRDRVTMESESPRDEAKRKIRVNEQGGQPPQQPTHDEPQTSSGTHPQVNPAPTADGRALESPTSPTTITRPGAYRVLPGRPSQRATSTDSAVNMTNSDDGDAASTGDGTLLVEANLVEDGDDARPREALSPLVEATPIRRRRQLAFLGIAVILVVAVIVGLVTGFVLNPPPQSPVSPPTNPPTPRSGDVFVQSLPPYTKASLLNESSPQARALEWVRNNDTVPWRDERNDTSQLLSRELQRFALATLYFSTNGALWSASENWLNRTSSECEWKGCCCGPECKQFEFDPSPGEFVGNESDSTVLTAIFMSENNLVGTLPREIWLLRNLQRLDLNGNTITASIPTQVSDLRALVALRLENVLLTSSLPTQLGLMTNLLDLSVGRKERDSAITGNILSELASLKALTSLHLYRINLNSTLPSFLGELTNLESLHLPGNKFKSTLPSELGKLTKLTSLRLDQNSLSGSIPVEWGNLIALRALELWTNGLNGTLPSDLGRLTRMGYFSLSDNAISGRIPHELFDLTALTTLDLMDNHLTSTLSTQIGLLTRLYDVYLRGNHLSGSIPTEIGLLSDLNFLALPSNRFSQTIPTQFGFLTSLAYLNLGNNTFTGSIPSELGNSTALTFLDLNSNGLNSTLSSALGSLSQLTELRFNRNALSGSIPSDFARLTSLDPIYPIRFGTNNLTGSVPDDFCRLVQEKSLIVYVDCNEVECNCSCECADSQSDDTYGGS
jgi:Leucine-rich repeat (LRR) protein